MDVHQASKLAIETTNILNKMLRKIHKPDNETFIAIFNRQILFLLSNSRFQFSLFWILTVLINKLFLIYFKFILTFFR
jgi:hypothetical protein